MDTALVERQAAERAAEDAACEYKAGRSGRSAVVLPWFCVFLTLLLFL